jgi:hypothetical protein
MPGLNYASVRALALDRAQPSTVLAGTTRDGVLRSADGGRNWAGPGAGFWALDVSGIATDRSAPQTVWLSTGTGVWRTTDGGASWGLKSEALSNRSAQCIAFEPASRTLYACTGDGVFRSTDGGEKWARHHSGLSRDTRIIGLAIDPANPKTLHARDAHWVYGSTDGGVTWTKSAADLESSGSINGLFALAAVPAGVSPAQAAVFASVHRQFWRSTDGAASFGKSGSGLPLARVQTVASDADGRTLWVGTEGEGVWRSIDGGATWTESRAGMGAVNVQALLTDPATPGTLYAAAWSKGVYRSGDGGRTWNLVGGPPPHPDVIALALDPSAPGRLLVGTGGGSAWRLETR